MRPKSACGPPSKHGGRHELDLNLESSRIWVKKIKNKARQKHVVSIRDVLPTKNTKHGIRVYFLKNHS